MIAVLAVVSALVLVRVVDQHDGGALAPDAQRPPAAQTPLAALTPLAAGSSASPDPTPTGSPTPEAAPAAPVAAHAAHAALASAATARAAAATAATAAVTALAAGKDPSSISVAACNMATGASYSWGATSGMLTGSIVKLWILETLLLQDQDNGTSISAAEQGTATLMIENSDNDAAEDLFEDIGDRDALIDSGPRLGMSHSVPGDGDYWGLTQTSATDYIALLKNLVAPTGSPLNPTSQAYVLGLMRQVESDQRWGVGVVADPGTDFANKNGWLAVDDDDDLWLVNSVGVVSIHGQQVLMAVQTQHDDDFDSGIDLTQQLAQAIAPAVTTS